MDRHDFSSDRPIKFLKDDLLGRKEFAESIARAIKSWRGKDSLVVALYGPWGGGKSSVKNMAVDTIRQFGPDVPEIVEFNPWYWAGQDGVLEAFFREIAVALRKADRSFEGRRRAVRWRLYGALLRTGSTFLSGLSRAISASFVLVSALGIGIAVTDAPLFRGALVSLLVITLAIAAVFRWGGEFSEHIANAFAYFAEIKRKGIEQIKSDLKSDLEKLKKPLLVVIDDIDRLAKEETRLLIRLVRANADFPNIVYLLIFQRDIVERNLEDAGLSGKDYLEKIVQVPFNIPQVEQSRVEKVLFSGLDRILEEDQKVAQRFDQTRWGNMFLGGLRTYFKTLRDVYRYLSTLSFHVELLRGDKAFEVNPIDLITLEVLRVFEPDVYRHLAEARVVLTDIHGLEKREERVTNTINAIIDYAYEGNKEHVREMIKQLFPTVEWALGGSRYGSGFADTWFHDLRVCHPDVFSRYFLFAVPEKDISQSELEDIISNIADRTALMDRFNSLRDRDLLDVALDRLDSYKQKIPIEHARSFLPALFDIADRLPRERPGFLDISAHSHASRIVYWYLRQEPNPDVRGEILYDSLAASHGVSLAGSLILTEDQRREKHKDVDNYLVSDDQLRRIKELFVTKVRDLAYAAPTPLRENKELASILYRWRGWGSPEEVSKWVMHFVEEQEGLLPLLVAFTREVKSHGVGDYVSRTRWEMELKHLEDFVSVDILKAQLETTDRECLSPEEKHAVETFEKAVHRREQGKSDENLWDND
ncbi:MAG: hypothetical protein JRI65_04925 [Deltaproteobacteria bacterium]|nr:hypothetical protein [Deltaproteobacteria bacterium]